MTGVLKLALVQNNPVVGDIQGNSAFIQETYQKLQSGCDLVVFPELALCGYSPEDLIHRREFIEACAAARDEILLLTRDSPCALLLPLPVSEGGKVYNSAQFIQNGQVTQTIHKHLLPNYGIFDEVRVFAHGALEQPNLTLRGFTFTLLICEDFWTPAVTAARAQNIDFILAINASPLEENKFARRVTTAQKRVHESGTPLIYLNNIGGQDEIIFDGASFALDSKGEIIAQLPAFTEDILHLTLEKQPSATHITPAFCHPYPNELATFYRGTTLGLRDYIGKNRFSDVLLGLSGGIDSALAAAIAVDALGANNVHTVMMPSPFTSRESLEDAETIAKSLGVSYQIIPIDDVMGAFERTIPDLAGLAHENMQSRARGTILMSLSNQSGRMLITTGNKSELATGYTTLYGDMCGGYNPLKDLYKRDVYALSRWRNDHKPEDAEGPTGPIIPERVLTRAPTAELRAHQLDQDSLPPYNVLDDILYHLIDRNQSPADIIQSGHPAETVEKIVKLLKNSEYKRRQAAPGAKLRNRSFGKDWRMPLTNKQR